MHLTVVWILNKESFKGIHGELVEPWLDKTNQGDNTNWPFYWTAKPIPWELWINHWKQNYRWFWDLNRITRSFLNFLCLVLLPLTRFLHILKLERFISSRISPMTSGSFSPYWNSMASNGVLSSHAISITRERCAFVSLSAWFPIFSDFACTLLRSHQH